MRFRTILTPAVLFLACLTVADWWAPLLSQPADRRFDPATQTGSVSGTISSVGAGFFSVQVQKSEDNVTLKFLLDSNTKIDGKLAVGAMVIVDYRNDGADNIAVHVVVKSSVRSD